MSKRGRTLEGAIKEGLHNLAWRHGVILVQYDDGSFDSIPPDYLGEVVWAGYEHMERNLGNLRDRVLDANLGFPLAEAEVQRLTERIREEVLGKFCTDSE